MNGWYRPGAVPYGELFDVGYAAIAVLAGPIRFFVGEAVSTIRALESSLGDREAVSVEDSELIHSGCMGFRSAAIDR
jgi:hypothetical protein